MRFGPQQRLRIELNNTRAGSNPLEQRRTSDWLDWRFPSITCCIAVRMHKLKVGDLVQAELSGGRVVEATVMAVINKTDGTRLQVSFGHETALIYLWQVVKTNSANTDTRKSR
jgi:hypothetical protein